MTMIVIKISFDFHIISVTLQCYTKKKLDHLPDIAVLSLLLDEHDVSSLNLEGDLSLL